MSLGREWFWIFAAAGVTLLVSAVERYRSVTVSGLPASGALPAGETGEDYVLPPCTDTFRGSHSKPLVRVHASFPVEVSEAIRAQAGENGHKAVIARVAAEAREAGLETVYLVQQDPTAGNRFVILGRGELRPSRSGGELEILKSEPVAEPSLAPDSGDDRSLDPGLSPDDVYAVRRALKVETNPRHLAGFASTLEPCFPVAASMLRAKAKKEIDACPWAFTDVVTDVGPQVAGAIDTSLAALRASPRLAHMPPDLLRDEIRGTASLLAEGTPLAWKEITDQKTPPEIIKLAQCLLRDVGDGRKVVCASRLRRALPPDGTEGYVSTSAVMLVAAAAKPEMAGIIDKDAIARRFAGIENPRGDDPQRLARANAAVGRARRALERWRWIEWYKKTSRAV